MSELAHPLTGKPFNLLTVLADADAEDAERTRRGLATPAPVEAALRDLIRKAARDDEAQRPAAWGEHFDEMLPGYDPDARDATRQAEAVVRAELARLVAVRVNPTEAGRMTGYHRNHILRLLRDGGLYGERDGNEWRIPVYALDALPPRDPRGRPRKVPPAGD